MVRITTGFDDKGKQLYKVLGYVKNRKEGLEMLAEYHKNPHAIENNMTFGEVYDKIVERMEGTVTPGTMRSYSAAFKAASHLGKIPMKDVKLQPLQDIIDKSKITNGSKAKYKSVYSKMFEYAIQNDICEKNYAKFIQIGTIEKADRRAYTDEEIKLLWDNQGEFYTDVTLVLLYTGMRIGELIDMKIEDVHLDEQYMVGGSKTEAGKNRTIALADKIMPIIRKFYGDGSRTHLLISPLRNKPLTYMQFKHSWDKRMKALGITQGIHETRHTTVTNLYKVGVAKEIIQKLVGHSGTDVTDKIYLHIGLDQLLEAVNKLQ